MISKPATKYQPIAPVALTDRQWPTRSITHAPVWLSTDLRDGNQALFEPMNGERKMKLFHELVRIGFKEIEVGFPAASQTDFDFVRRLIDEHLIPDDVTIMVMTQSREDLIARTVEAVPYSAFEQALADGRVAEVIIGETTITGTLKTSEPDGKTTIVANRVEGGKRPRSSMAPTIVYGPDGKVRLAIGAAGGATIIAQIAKALIGVIDWNLTAQDAIAMGLVYAPGKTASIEEGTELETMLPALQGRALAHGRDRHGSPVRSARTGAALSGWAAMNTHAPPSQSSLMRLSHRQAVARPPSAERDRHRTPDARPAPDRGPLRRWSRAAQRRRILVADPTLPRAIRCG